jgi:hypothetical protein
MQNRRQYDRCFPSRTFPAFCTRTLFLLHSSCPVMRVPTRFSFLLLNISVNSAATGMQGSSGIFHIKVDRAGIDNRCVTGL